MARAVSVAPIILVALLAACSAGTSETAMPSEGATSVAATASPSAEASATEEASATAEATATPVADAQLTLNWTIPFTITAPANWEAGPDTTESGLELREELRIVMMVFLKEGETPGDWVERLTTAEALDASEPEPVEVGGASGQVLDIRVNASAPECDSLGARKCFPIHQDPGGNVWIAEIDRPMRIWILDVEGQTVLIATDSREDRFEAWASRFEDVITTLEWRES